MSGPLCFFPLLLRDEWKSRRFAIYPLMSSRANSSSLEFLYIVLGLNSIFILFRCVFKLAIPNSTKRKL
jgi:hypothetical protein